MPSISVTGWNPEKAWASRSFFSKTIVLSRIRSVSPLRGVELRQLTRKLLRHEALEIQIKPGVDPAGLIDFLQCHGAEFEMLNSDAHLPLVNE